MKAVAAMLCCLVVGAASAQQSNGPRPPTDTELTAAYCTALVRQRHENVAASSHPAMRDLEKSLKARHQRLVDFMEPRLRYLDSAALESAVRRAATDQTDFEQMTSGCFGQCVPPGITDLKQGRQECVDRCMSESDVAKRVRLCDDVFWLAI